MHGRAVSSRLFWGQLLNLTATASIAVIAWLINTNFNDANYQSWPTLLLDSFKKLQQKDILGVEVLFLSLLLAAVIFLIGFILSRSTWARDKQLIQYILDKAKNLAYEANANDPVHHHRVTLFKYKKYAIVHHWSGENHNLCIKKAWPWGKMHPWTGWLKPIARSGHTSQGTKTRFLAPSSGEAEGVCGRAWCSDSVVVKTGLPEIKPNKSAYRRQYAENTYCDKAMIDYITKIDKSGEIKIPPRSIGAIPIHVNGDVWGVLVFDSRSPDGVSKTIGDDFKLTVGLIEKILEK